MKHLNPRQGITTKNCVLDISRCVLSRVKHLNPRQGITTYDDFAFARGLRGGVKHLNPRQGITTNARGSFPNLNGSHRCETPKSPPGDYNDRGGGDVFLFHFPLMCETPKSPPGDYNLQNAEDFVQTAVGRCETPKSPPGDYNRALYALLGVREYV